MSDNRIDNAQFWRERAAEVRAQAAQMHDLVSRRMMLAIAESYEGLAKRVEQKAQGSRV
jgi:hypothetical protein